MEQFAHAINRLNEVVGKCVAWLTVALVLLVCYEVLIGVFNQSSNWVTELEWHLFSLIFLLGAGYAFKHDRHVRVDLFYTRFAPKDKALTDLLGSLLFLLPWTIVLIYFSYFYALESFRIGEGSPDPGGLPARYWIKFSIVIGLFLLLLQGIAEVIQSFLVYRGKQSIEILHPNEPHEPL